MADKNASKPGTGAKGTTKSTGTKEPAEKPSQMHTRSSTKDNQPADPGLLRGSPAVQGSSTLPANFSKEKKNVSSKPTSQSQRDVDSRKVKSDETGGSKAGEKATPPAEKKFGATYTMPSAAEGKANKNSTPGGGSKPRTPVDKSSKPDATGDKGEEGGDKGAEQPSDTQPDAEDQSQGKGSTEAESAITKKPVDGAGLQGGHDDDKDIVSPGDAVDGTKISEELNGCKKRIVELQTKDKEQAKEIDFLKTAKADLENAKKELQYEREQCLKRIEQLRKEGEKQAQENEALTAYLKVANDDIKKFQEEIDAGCLREGHLTDQLRKQKGATKEFQKELGGKEHELKELQKEYRDLKERFGKMAGEKMKHNNPDIINLGDQNRSTKIAERYSTLYNEAWTDAWSDQTENNIPEEEATENLLEVLKDCYKYCTEQAERQYEQLSNILYNPVQSVDMNKPVPPKASASKDTSDTSDTTLRELRKEISLRATEQVKNEFWEDMKQKQKNAKWLEGSKVFIQQCAEICWAMVLNLPPLYMEFEVKPGTEVNTNFYTKRSSGKVFKQLVWPALFNGMGGGMLAKGVVEAAKTISKK